MAVHHRTIRPTDVRIGLEVLGRLGAHRAASIDEERWVPLVRETDVLLVNGGDALYLCHWMRQSGLADLLPSLRETVWVGFSAGSMVMTPASRRIIGWKPPTGGDRALESLIFDLPAPGSRTCRAIPLTEQNDGRPGSQIRRMRSTIRPPSK
jgi:hypothetical protein